MVGIQGEDPSPVCRVQAFFPALHGVGCPKGIYTQRKLGKGKLGEDGKKQGPLPLERPQFSGNLLTNSLNSPILILEQVLKTPRRLGDILAPVQAALRKGTT